MNKLRELPRKRKRKKAVYAYREFIDNLNGTKINNLATIECPACRIAHINYVGNKFDCFRCGAKIMVPVAVGIK